MSRRLTLSVSAIFAFLTVAADAQFLQHRRKAFQTAAVTFLINQDFEGTGTPAGWGGTGNFDSTTSPLAGAQSARMTSGTTLYNSGVFSNADIWFKFLFRFSALPGSAQDIFAVTDASFNACLTVKLLTDGTVLVQDTGVGIFEITASAMSASTLYYVWVHYVKGTGSNAVCQVYFNTADSRPTFGDGKTAGASTGVVTVNAEQFFFVFTPTADIDNCQAAATSF